MSKTYLAKEIKAGHGDVLIYAQIAYDKPNEPFSMRLSFNPDNKGLEDVYICGDGLKQLIQLLNTKLGFQNEN